MGALDMPLAAMRYGAFTRHRERRYRGPAKKTCQYCGKGDLKWGQHEGKWRLFSQVGKLHTCDEFYVQTGQAVPSSPNVERFATLRHTQSESRKPNKQRYLDSLDDLPSSEPSGPEFEFD